MVIAFFVLLILAVLLEGTIIPLPLMLVCLLCFATVQKDSSVFLSAFIGGLVLDILMVNPVGTSSLFFLLFLFLVFLYQRKYEINSFPFVILASFIGSWVFLSLYGYEAAFIRAGISSLLTICLFGILQLFTYHKQHQHTTHVIPKKGGIHFRKNEL